MFGLFFFFQSSLSAINETYSMRDFQQKRINVTLENHSYGYFAFDYENKPYSQKMTLGVYFPTSMKKKLNISITETESGTQTPIPLTSDLLYYTTTGSMLYVWFENDNDTDLNFEFKVAGVYSNSGDRIYFSASPNDCISYYSQSSYNYDEADFIISTYSPQSLYYVNMHDDAQKMEIDLLSKSSLTYINERIYAYDQAGSYVQISKYGGHIGDSRKGIAIRFQSTSTDMKAIDIKMTSKTSSTSDYSGFYCSFSTSTSQSIQLCKYRQSKQCYSPNKTTDSVIQGLVIAIAVYAGIIALLLILNFIMACIHPNRLYRLGITCYCCYCCCTEPYYYSHTYYSAHYYHRPCFCYCGDCNCDTGSSDGNNVVIIIFLIIILLILIFLAIVLAYTLYCLCVSADEEERAWEAENISRFHRDSRDPQVILGMNDVQSSPPSTPINQSLVGDTQQNVYNPTPQYGQQGDFKQAPPPQPYVAQPSPQPYAAPPPQPYVAQPQQPYVAQPQQPYAAPQPYAQAPAPQPYAEPPQMYPYGSPQNQMNYVPQAPQQQPSPYQDASLNSANPYDGLDDPYNDKK